jgi:D-beta-D-heptose 7-phosphate kinase/D-beta-D-heptose 1-phosphate adenosyltransferase
MNLDQITQKLKNYPQSTKKVLVTGVFDILHRAHLEFLKQAKLCGDILIVGVESDKRVFEIKGEGRPVNTANTRLENLSKTMLVDLVFELPDQFSQKEDHENLISKIRPDILAVSSHTKHLEAKKSILNKYGGDVKIVLEHDPSISTTQLLKLSSNSKKI